MKKLLVPIAILATGFALFIGYKRFAEKTSYRLAEVKLVKLGFPLSNIQVKIAVTNPTNTSVSVDSVFLNINYSGKTIAQVEHLKPFSIEPSKTTTIVVPITIETSKLGLSIIEALEQVVRNKQNPTIEVQGTINLSIGIININEITQLKVY